MIAAFLATPAMAAAERRGGAVLETQMTTDVIETIRYLAEQAMVALMQKRGVAL